MSDEKPKAWIYRGRTGMDYMGRCRYVAYPENDDDALLEAIPSDVTLVQTAKIEALRKANSRVPRAYSTSDISMLQYACDAILACAEPEKPDDDLAKRLAYTIGHVEVGTLDKPGLLAQLNLMRKSREAEPVLCRCRR